MKDFINKYFNKEKFKKAWEWCVTNKRFFIAALLFVGLLIVLKFGAVPKAVEETVPSTDVPTTEVSTEENGGSDFVLDETFAKDANQDVNNLIATYFKAYASADFDTLEMVASPLSDNEKSYIGVFSQYIESYENVACYTKTGMTENSYLVSAYFDLKFYGVSTMAPGLDFFYVETKEDGTLCINNLYCSYNLNRTENDLDPNVYAVILKFEQQEDSIALRTEVENAYTEAVASDVDLALMLTSTIPEAMADWMQSIIAAENGEVLEEDTTPQEDEVLEEDGTDEADNPEEAPEDDATAETGENDAVAEDTPVEEAPQETTPTELKIKVTYKSVNVRSKPSTSSGILGSAKKGETYTKLDETDGWTKIKYKGETGYIKSDYVEDVTE